MSNIKVLDCTLRDGGYVNEWHFGTNVIKGIVSDLANAHIDIIEMGFLTKNSHTAEDALYSTTSEMQRVTGGKGSSLMAGMIALGEKEIDADSVDTSASTGIDIIRITFHNDSTEIDRAIQYAHILMSKGYLVCMQPVGTTSYTNEELLDLIVKINTLKPYAFYLVDTLGTLYKDKLMHFIHLIDDNLDKDIAIGFHSHNNLQMSYSNAQLLVEYDSDRLFILDSSLYGMGRGAGNLNTELITNFINEYSGIDRYDIVSILDGIDNYIYPLSLTFDWGYYTHYYMSAIHNCHPNYAAYLINMQTLTMNDINKILQRIPKDICHIYKKNIIEDLYLDYQKSLGTKVQYSLDHIKGKEILVIAPGKSIKKYKKQIMDFAKNNNVLVFTVNTDIEDIRADYVFISNKKRLLDFDYNATKSKVIITSNLPKLSDKFECVDYDSLCNRSYHQPDNSGIMLLRLLAIKGCKKAILAGFDGYRVDTDNYATLGTVAGRYSNQNTLEKNDSISKQIKDISATMPIQFLTPSIYEDDTYEEI